MTDTTQKLGLPFILPAQAQKHVTHNEALQRLDALVHIAIADELISPPDEPDEGVCYLVGPGASASWSGHDGQIALFQDGLWQFIQPAAGWSAWFSAVQQNRFFDGAAWTVPAFPQDSSVATLGINATADLNNRLAVAAPSTLFNNDGGGHQLKVNKQSPDDTASLLFQTGWSGRAEMGLAGSDSFAIKTSADGSNWFEALRLDPSGAVHQPQKPIVRAAPTGGAVTVGDGETFGFDTIFSNQGDFALGDPVTAGGQSLVFPTSGYYAIHMVSTAAASAFYALELRKNGTETVLRIAAGQNGDTNTTIGASAIMYMSIGDKLTFLSSGTPTHLFGYGATEVSAFMI